VYSLHNVHKVNAYWGGGQVHLSLHVFVSLKLLNKKISIKFNFGRTQHETQIFNKIQLCYRICAK
jgi:hypothetical protein